MKAQIFLLLLALATSACQSGKQTSEKSQQDCWQLNGNDKVLTIDESTLGLYEPFSKIEQHSIDLVRAIDGETYDVFIGVSEKLHSDDLAVAQLQISKHQIIGIRKNSGKSGRHYHDFLIREKEHFVFRSIYSKAAPGSTVVVNIVSQDSARIRAYFNAASFVDKKLSCN
jgi:hypothetical protein